MPKFLMDNKRSLRATDLTAAATERRGMSLMLIAPHASVA
jgi:hypothetical protein